MTDNKAMTAFGGGGKLAVSTEAKAAALLEAGTEGGGGNDVEYLTFSGRGDNFKGWLLGRDKAQPDPSALYVLDPEGVFEGWTCWKEGRPAGKEEWNVYERAEKAIRYEDLPDHGPYRGGDGWVATKGVTMFDVDMPDSRIIFSTTSISGRNALGSVLSEMGKRMAGGENHVPVIGLDSELFTSKEGQVNGKPVFRIEAWVTSEEVHAFLGAGKQADIEALLNGEYAGAQAEPEVQAASTPGRRSRRSAA